MTVESATYISDLNATYPPGTDLKSEGDDHLRLIKSAVKATFPNVTGAVTPTHTELNYVDGVTSGIQAQLNAITSAGGKNLLDNGQMKVWQRSTNTTGADNAYVAADRWKVLSDGITVEQSRVTGEAGYAMRLGLAANNKKIGTLQVIENIDAARLQGKTVTLSARLKAGGANVDDVRMVVLSWTGTADTVTDPVASWNGSGTLPTWDTGWTAENTAANLAVTTDWATYSVTAALDTSAITNVAVLIFTCSTTPTSTDHFDIDWVQLEAGSTATGVEDRPASVDTLRCQRFYRRWQTWRQSGYAGGAAEELYYSIPLDPPMRTTPTCTDQESTHTNISGTVTFSGVNAGMVLVLASADAAGRTYINLSTLTLSADL